MQEVETVTVGTGGAASITFSSIPATFTDLVILSSVRSDRSTVTDSLKMNLNGNSSNQSTIILRKTSGVSNMDLSTIRIADVPAASRASGIFGNASTYITSYLSSQAKAVSSDYVSENNASDNRMGITASLWDNTAAVTSIVLEINTGDFAEHSTATLYGIKSTAGSGAPKATGGMISYDAANNKWVHVFTSSGTFTPTEDLTCEYLVIAGGGGGGGGQGGGGGAGGYRSSVTGESSGGGASAESALSLTNATDYTVTLGSGGNGGGFNSQGGNGTASVFSTITSTGGGGGGSYNNNNASGSEGSDGGSGGGAGSNNSNSSGGNRTTDQGFAGGNSTSYVAPFIGGSGGGASEVGSNGPSAGSGGDGVASSITGSSVTRAGGGGAGGDGVSRFSTGGNGGGGGGGASPVSGEINTGGGGGGSVYANNQPGAAGGSGIVIVRYDA